MCVFCRRIKRKRQKERESMHVHRNNFLRFHLPFENHQINPYVFQRAKAIIELVQFDFTYKPQNLLFIKMTANGIAYIRCILDFQ